MTPGEKKLAVLEQLDDTEEVPRISMSDMEDIIDSLPDESVVTVLIMEDEDDPWLDYGGEA
tara:strand:+ start:305 stop:487 length:183 start_codon:yes stop_codon:yes gene_type:complete